MPAFFILKKQHAPELSEAYWCAGLCKPNSVFHRSGIMTIYLDRWLLIGSCELPKPLVADWPLLLHQRGFTTAPCYHGGRCLADRCFTLRWSRPHCITFHLCQPWAESIVSVALSIVHIYIYTCFVSELLCLSGARTFLPDIIGIITSISGLESVAKKNGVCIEKIKACVFLYIAVFINLRFLR